MNPLDRNTAPEPALEFVYAYGPTMRGLNAIVAEIAPTSIPVLIAGECGTGKDTYARLIHRLSQENHAGFQRVDCASLQAGALTWLTNGQLAEGQGEENRGTIYLDGIQDLDLHCQRILLSRLCNEEDRAKNRSLRHRLISSTNTSLEPEIESGRFRGELYFRINGTSIRLPPLRERKEDIVPLLEYFLRKHSSSIRGTIPAIGRSTQELLMGYAWPGNIRQLENLALKILTLGESRALDELFSQPVVGPRPERSVGVPSLKMAVRAASKQTERELIIQALERTRWNRKRAAEQLRISYKSFLNKLKAIDAAAGGIGLKGGK
jgi:DNA-binding NtrC family response regulator